jgi:Tol biopolymer transport system component
VRVRRGAPFLVALCIPLAGISVASPAAQAAIQPISTTALVFPKLLVLNEQPPGASAVSADGRHILFFAYGDRQFRYNTSSGGWLPAPEARTMSRDGRWFANISPINLHQSLSITTAFGSDKQVLGENVFGVSLSGDGSKAAFVEDVDGVTHGYVWSRETGARVHIDDGLPRTGRYSGPGSVSISADGRYVAYVYIDLDSAGCAPSGVSGCQYDAWRYDTLTGRRERISSDSEGSRIGEQIGGVVLSGNGRVAAFVSRPAGLEGPVHVYRKNLDNGELREIVSYPFKQYSGLYAPSISDDGDRIAFAHNVDTDPRVHADPAFMYERSSDSTVRLTTKTRWSPLISGDGSTVVYGELAEQDDREPVQMIAHLPGTIAAPLVAVAAKTSITVQLKGDFPFEPKAAVLNVTIVGPEAAGYATVWPCDEPRPNTSNLNFLAGQTVANAVITKPSKKNTICVYTDAAADILVDESGYLSLGNSFVGQNPSRVLDTRDANPAPGLDVGAVATVGPFNAEADSVVLNVTATNAAAAGFVTAWPCDQLRPNASSVNFVPGTSVPNLVIAKTSADHTVCLFTDHPVDLIADLSGWFPAGGGYHGLTPVRTFDSRKPGSGPQLADRPTNSGVANVESDVRVPADANAVVLNLTATNPAEPGFGSASTCSGFPPNTSNLNFVAGQTVPNLVVTQPSSYDRTVCLFSSTPIDYIVDSLGYFPAGSGYVDITPTRLADTRSA